MAECQTQQDKYEIEFFQHAGRKVEDPEIIRSERAGRAMPFDESFLRAVWIFLQ